MGCSMTHSVREGEERSENCFYIIRALVVLSFGSIWHRPPASATGTADANGRNWCLLFNDVDYGINDRCHHSLFQNVRHSPVTMKQPEFSLIYVKHSLNLLQLMVLSTFCKTADITICYSPVVKRIPLGQYCS